MKYLISFICIVIWVTGVVIAKGFWSTFFAITTGGFYSFYLVIELLLNKYGFI